MCAIAVSLKMNILSLGSENDLYRSPVLGFFMVTVLNVTYKHHDIEQITVILPVVACFTQNTANECVTI